MPNLHDIERRINSVRSTKQITHTMEMVSAAKIRRATERMTNATPWTVNLNNMIVDTAKNVMLEEEPLLQIHDGVKNVLIVVMTSDRGLAGGFSSNVLKAAERMMRRKEAEGAHVSVIACGKKACGYFNYRNITPVLEFKGSSADPTFYQATEMSLYISDAYQRGDLDEVFCVYNHAKNAGEQRLIEQKILPVDYIDFSELLGLKKEKDVLDEYRDKPEEGYKHDFDFEPSAAEVLHRLMQSYLRNLYYFALLDSAAAEQGARRTAMKAATDNANEMVDTLTTIYNRVRQGAITTEINEIVGGAAALEE